MIGLIKKAKIVKNRTQVVFWVDFGINLEIQKLSMTGKVQSTQPAKDSKLVTHIRATMIKSFFKKQPNMKNTCNWSRQRYHGSFSYQKQDISFIHI